jgi:4-amino-4-deoxy-L-arabinose transferase-like glycosyltransferase
MYLVVGDPTFALQIVSFLASLWVVFPLVALFSLWLRRDLAIAAAVLYLFTPATLILGCRAFTGPLATALLACALAFWLRHEGGSRNAAAGSVVAGLCLLTRPHFFPAIVAVMGYRVFISRSSRERLLVVAPTIIVVTMAFGAVAVDAGGVRHLWQALEQHAGYHFGQLAGAELAFSDSALARAFLKPGFALVWIALVIFGLGGALRHRRLFRSGTVVAFLGLGPLVITVHGFSYAGNVRYALPIVALGSGIAMVGTAILTRKMASPAVAVICVAVFVAAWPALGEYRRVESPPVRALDFALAEAGQRGAVIVADESLAAFFDYERSRNGIPFTVLFAFQICTETVPPPAWATVAIFDAGHGQYVERAEETSRFACQRWWLSRLSQGRFIDLTVASGAATRKVPLSKRRSMENAD